MKPLLVNTHDQIGGAARSAYRLLCALRNEQVAVNLLVRDKKSHDEDVIMTENSWFGWCRAYLDFLVLKMCFKRRSDVFSAAKVPDVLRRWVRRLQPDLLHLHWTSGGILKIETLQTLELPIVWTMHDSWVFTGGCHLPGGCTKYEEKCGGCPLLGSQVVDDLSRQIWLRKQSSYPLKRMTFVSPSRWLADKARASSLLGNAVVDVIPNGIDTSIYSPGDKQEVRSACGFPADRKIILFGARHAQSDTNKGMELLWETLGKLTDSQRRKCRLIVFGEGIKGFIPPVDIEFQQYGEVNDDEALVRLFRASDLFLMTSLQENLPNTISESMSCGLPCAAFSIGGIPEQIVHRQSGCLAKAFDTSALAAEIAWFLQHEGKWSDFAEKSREYVLTHCSFEKVARRHLDLYERVLEQSRNS